MAAEKNVPKIRFKGFEEEWEEKKLKQISSNISDGDWIEANHIFDEGEYRIIQTGNLGIGEYLDKSGHAKYFHQKDFNEIKANELFPGDILISRLAEPAGRTIVLPNTGFRMVTAVDVTIIRPESKKFNSHFLMTGMNRDETLKSVSESVAGTSHKRISRSNLENIGLHIPTLPEQTQIGTYFQNLDSLISLHQRKYDKLLTVKKAMLEKMFPREGADVPEIRFKGFEGKWIEKTLGVDIANIVGGGTPSTFEQTYWNGTIDWYSPTEIGKNVFAYGSEKKITELGMKNCSAKFLPADKTILFTSRAGIGDMAILKKTGTTNQGFQSLVLNEDYDTYFIYSMGHLIKKYALKNSSGSTFLEISGKNLGKMKILVPNFEEQTKIGTFFQNLDTQISQHQKQLEKLKNVKKACLEKMFV